MIFQVRALLDGHVQDDRTVENQNNDSNDEPNKDTQDSLEEINDYIANFEQNSVSTAAIECETNRTDSSNGFHETVQIENVNNENECYALKRKLDRFKCNLKDSKNKVKKLEEQVLNLKSFNFQLQEQLLKKTSIGNTLSSAVSPIEF